MIRMAARLRLSISPMPLPEMRRILVIGSGGAGKSKLARDLGRILGLPVVNLDAHYWNPGWVETPTKEWGGIVKRLIKGDQWIMDGNYGGTFLMRIKAADTVIFLDYSRYLCIYRVLKRQLSGKRVDVIPGCHEKIDRVFLKWLWDYSRTSRPRMMNIMNEEGTVNGKRVFILKRPADTRKFLDAIRKVRVQ